MESPYDDEFFDDLATFLPGLRHAKFLGGEPFLIPEHHRVWELLNQTGANPRLHVTTNGTIWNDRVERLLNDFVVDLAISIDGATAPTYEAVRAGGDFSEVKRNLDRFIAASRAKGAHLHLNFCLMPQTAHELHLMLEWGDQLGVPVHAIVVSDPGYALHDLPTEQLERIAQDWERDAARPLGQNAEEWATQVRQLHAVLNDRRAGGSAATGQAFPAAPGFLGSVLDGLSGAATDGSPAVEFQRLADWSGGGPVAMCRVGTDQTITGIDSPHHRLGITDEILGRHVDDLIAVLESADGRTAWAIEAVEVRPGLAVRAVVLSATRPSRGGAGSVVRFVRTSDSEGAVILIAEDRFYDAPPLTEVRVANPTT